MTYIQESMYKEGIAEFEKASMMSPDNPGLLSGLGYAYAVAGKRTEAQKVLDRLNESSKQKYVSAWYRATIYAGLGETDKAFEWLAKAYEERTVGVDIRVVPAFNPMRSDPRFADLLRRMNLQP
jgi:tetratricopeptide (TPR) repeat protein